MTMDRKIPRPPETNERFFENYEISDVDLEELGKDIDIVAESGLIEKSLIDEMRIVTFDSNFLYVFTRGNHVSTRRFNVEEMAHPNKNGFKIYKIRHSGFIGRRKEDYIGAQAGILCDEIETTAVNAKRYRALFRDRRIDPHTSVIELLYTARIPPKDSFDMIHAGKFDYLTDGVFHEIGHNEQYQLEESGKRDDPDKIFPTIEQARKFMLVIERNKIFPQSVTQAIMRLCDAPSLREMYTMLIDREAQRRYRPNDHSHKEKEWGKGVPLLKDITHPDKIHARGRALVRILEEEFPDYNKRKEFVLSVFRP